MGRGAWQVTVHRAARSWIQPSERTRTLNHKAALMHVPPSPNTSICCEPQGSGLQPRARGDLPVLLPCSRLWALDLRTFTVFLVAGYGLCGPGGDRKKGVQRLQGGTRGLKQIFGPQCLWETDRCPREKAK